MYIAHPERPIAIDAFMGGMAMYKRILIPTDGSEASQRAILAAVDFARETGAEVVGLTATPEFHVVSTDTSVLEATPEQYSTNCAALAGRRLADIENAARGAGVACRTEHVSDDDPYAAIIAAAERHGCDLIIMASHGRRGLRGLLLGSETQKVLVHSTLPVLVHR
jgi:nucleotide-binding universal stress UspA family protein